jgi:phospholipid/cholesterol/gamma-HCH transport system substrate-binding protein
MQRKTVDVLVGIFVLTGAAAVLFLALQAGNLASFTRGETYVVIAKFNNIGGLKMRSPVKSAGVVVGRVSAITFDDKTYQASVSLELEKRFAFPKDTSASILTAGLLGEQYIGLNPGADTDNLDNGNRLASTQDAVVLESLISQFLFKSASDAGGDAKK